MMKENGRKPNSACHQEHVQVLNSLTDTLKDELKRGLTLLDNCVNQLAQAKWILINVERTIEDFYADCPACDVKSKTGNSAVTPPSASGAPANSASTPALNSSSTTQSSSGGAGARKSTGGSKAAKKASVLPMVSGHTVQRPKINIARVDSNKSKKSKQRTERDTVSASRVRSRGSGSSALATITASASAGISIDDSADELAAGPSQSAAAAEPGTSQTPQRKKNKPGPLSKTRVTNSNSGGETAAKRDFSCDGADISVDLDDIGYLLSGKTFFKGSELYKFPQIILEAAPAGSPSKPETTESKTKIKSDTPTTTESAKKRKLTLSSDSDEEPLENLKKKSATVSSTKIATKVATPEAGSSNATASPKVPLKPKLPSALFAKLGQSLLTKLKTGTAKLPGKSPFTPAPPSESGSANKDDEKKVVSVKKEVVKHEKEDNDKNKNIKDDDNSDSASDSNSKTKANDSKKLPNKSSDESEAEIIPSKIDRRTKPADRHKIQNSKNANDSGDESETEVLPSKNRGGASVNKKGVGGKKTNKGKSSDDSDDPEFIVSPSKKSRSRSSAGPKSKQQLQPSASSKIKPRATVSSGDESNDSDNDSNTSSRQRNKSGAKKSTKAAVTSRVNSSSKSLEVENENDGKSNSKSSPATESVEKEADKENPVDLEDDNKSSASVDPVPARPKPGPASAKAKRIGGRPGPMSAKLKIQEQNDSSAMDVDGSDNGKDKDNVTTTNSINFSTKIFTDSDSDSSELAKIKKKIPLDLQDAVRSPSPNRPNSSDIFGKLLGTYKSTINTAGTDTEAPSTPLQNLKVKVGMQTNSEIFKLEERVREKLSSVGRELVPYSGPIEMCDELFTPGNYYVVGKHNEEKLVFCDESSELQELDLSSGDIDELMNID